MNHWTIATTNNEPKGGDVVFSKRRIAQIETKLTAQQQVLLLLTEAIKRFKCFFQYRHSITEDPLASLPRDLIASRVEKSMQEAGRRSLLTEGKSKKVINEAKKWADFLFMLAHNINAQLCESSWDSIFLMEQWFRRMSLQFRLQKLSNYKEWAEWRERLIDQVLRMSALRAAVAEITAKYFNGIQITFDKQKDEFNAQLERAEGLAMLYNQLAPKVRSWKPIELENSADLIRSETSKLVRAFVIGAEAETLHSYGEVLAARRLIQTHLARH